MALVKSVLWRLVYHGGMAEGEREVSSHYLICAKFNSHAACRPLPQMLSSVTMYWVGGREGEGRRGEGRGEEGRGGDQRKGGKVLLLQVYATCI